MFLDDFITVFYFSVGGGVRCCAQCKVIVVIFREWMVRRIPDNLLFPYEEDEEQTWL